METLDNERANFVHSEAGNEPTAVFTEREGAWNNDRQDSSNSLKCEALSHIVLDALSAPLGTTVSLPQLVQKAEDWRESGDKDIC